MAGIVPLNPQRLPTADQDAALDAANAPDAGNPFATIADVVGTADSVKVSGADTTAGYLSDKLTGSPTSITWVIVNPGADEDLRLTIAAATTLTRGLIELATQAEVNAGVNATFAVTPATLALATTVIKNGQAAGGGLAGTYPSPTVAVVPFPVVQASLATASSAIDVGTQRITNMGNPAAAQDATTKSYVDALLSGLDVKASCRLLTDTNDSLSGLAARDGVVPVAGDRILATAQTTPADNGIWVAAAGAWARATDADSSAEVTAGMFTYIAEGTTYADSGWVLTTNDPINLGVTALAFSQFSGAGQITAGTGLTKTGNTLDVGAHADGSIVVNANDVQVGILATDAQHGTRGGGSIHATATDAVQGFVELATQAEVNTGTDTVRAVTPLTLGNATSINGQMRQHFQDVGTTASPTTTATTFTTAIPEMTQAITPNSASNPIRIAFTGSFSNSNANVFVAVALFIDGVEETGTERRNQAAAADRVTIAVEKWVTLSVAAHTIEVRWKVEANTGTADDDDRILVIEEFNAP